MSSTSASPPHDRSGTDSAPSIVIAEHADEKDPDSSFTPPPTMDPPRSRTSRACSSCNRQKLRCDGGKPCTRCINHAISERCEYLPSLRGKTRKRKIRPAPETLGSPGELALQLPKGESLAQPPSKKPHMLPPILNSQFAYWKHDSATPRRIPLPGKRGPPRAAERGNEVDTSLNRTGDTLPFVLLESGEPRNRPASLISSLASDREHACPQNPLAVLAEASTAPRPSNLSRPQADPECRPASTGLDSAVTGAGSGSLPSSGILAFMSYQLAEQLFAVYFRTLHPHYPFLDVYHCHPQAVYKRSECLFNAICIVSARATDGNLWRRLKDFAQAEMSRLPGKTTIDTVQAHLIYAVWNPFSEDPHAGHSTWTRAGLAVRTAMDIGLDNLIFDKNAHKALPNWPLRSISRTWLFACTLDQTLSTQLNRPSCLQEQATDAYYRMLMRSQEPPSLEDEWTVCLSEWGNLFSRAAQRLHDEILDLKWETSRVQKMAHHRPYLVRALEASVREWQDRAIRRVTEPGGDDRLQRIVLGDIRLYGNYIRLVIQSYALQRAEEHLPLDVAPALTQADFGGTWAMHGHPNFHHTVLTYAALTLSKTTEARYNQPETDHPHVPGLIDRAIDILSRSARTEDHLPAVSAAFLRDFTNSKDGVEAASSPDTSEMVNFVHFAAKLERDPECALWPPQSTQTGRQIPKLALSLGIGTFGEAATSYL